MVKTFCRAFYICKKSKYHSNKNDKVKSKDILKIEIKAPAEIKQQKGKNLRKCSASFCRFPKKIEPEVKKKLKIFSYKITTCIVYFISKKIYIIKNLQWILSALILTMNFYFYFSDV